MCDDKNRHGGEGSGDGDDVDDSGNGGGMIRVAIVFCGGWHCRSSSGGRGSGSGGGGSCGFGGDWHDYEVGDCSNGCNGRFFFLMEKMYRKHCKIWNWYNTYLYYWATLLKRYFEKFGNFFRY